MNPNQQSTKKWFSLITFGIVLYWAVNHPASALKVIQGFIGMFKPFILGICIAFIMNVLLKIIEKQWDRLFQKKPKIKNASYKRTLCILLTLLMIIGVIFIVIFMIVPELYRTASEIFHMVPWYLQKIDLWAEKISALFASGAITIPDLNIQEEELLNTIGSFLSSTGESVFSKTVEVTTSIFSTIFNLVLGLIFAIYILSSKEKLSRQCKKLAYAFLPEKKATACIDVFRLANHTFSKFVTGQFTEAVIIGTLCFLGMTVLSIPYASMIAVMTGFTALIPVVGAFIGIVFGVLMLITVSPLKAIWFIIFILILQQVEGNLIYPRVVGKSIGLPGIWVLLAVSVGGGTFGISGMLIGVPSCSLLYALLGKAANYRIKKKNISPDLLK